MNHNTGYGSRTEKILRAFAPPVALALALAAGTARAASFDVTVQNDNGTGNTSGTLSWAIKQANQNAGPHTITLKTNVTLTAAPQHIEQNTTITADTSSRMVVCGVPVIRTPFFIGGSNAGLGNYPTAANLSVTLSGFTITGCTAVGSAPWSSASTGGQGGGGGAGGGAVFVHAGNLTLQAMGLVANSARGGGSGSVGESNFGVVGGDGGGAGLGGAVFVRAGVLTLQGVSFVGNQVAGGTAPIGTEGSGRGGAVFVCTADLDSSQGNGNTAAENCSGSINTANSCGVSFTANSASSMYPNLFWNGHHTALNSLPACAPSGAVSQIVIDPVTPATLYSALDGAGVYKSTNSGSSWSTSNTGLTNLNAKALAISATGTTLYVGTPGGVFVSTTSGASWAACTTQPSNPAIRSLLIASSTLYAGTEAGVFASTDSCATWSAMSTGLP